MLNLNTSQASPQGCVLASQFLKGIGKAYLAVLWSLLYMFFVCEGDSPAGSHSPSLCLLLPFSLYLLKLIMKHTLTCILCRAPQQESPGSLSSQQFMLFPWWNIFWVLHLEVFPHSFQRSISDVRSLLRFLQLVCQSFVRIWLTADTYWPLLETATEKPEFSVHGWQTVTAVFYSGLFHLELCKVRLWEVWFPRSCGWGVEKPCPLVLLPFLPCSNL